MVVNSQQHAVKGNKKTMGKTKCCTSWTAERTKLSCQLLGGARIIHAMRINLVTPFAEKDAVKALGARWDASKKLWYILDVADITPFLRWIPKTEVATKNSATVSQHLDARPDNDQSRTPKVPKPSGLSSEVLHCGCHVLPWDDCAHTAKP